MDKATLLRLYEKMVLIRAFEERFRQEMEAGRLVAYGHLYSGQEAVAVGVCAHLGPQDYTAITYRGHGVAIARGLDTKAMMAEIYGRATGTNRGRGGSMHIADFRHGILGANVVVGATIPLAAGAALSAQLLKTGGVAVAFFGDGAVNQGVFHEGLNLAAVWKLPLLLVCENNLYAQSTPVDYATSVERLVDRAAAYSMPGLVADGQDVFSVYQVAGEAISRLRAGEGPIFLECPTYRFSGHYVGDNTLRYRSREEEAYHRERDCLRRFRERVVADGSLLSQELEALDGRGQALLDEAVRFAEGSPPPPPEEIARDLYAS